MNARGKLAAHSDFRKRTITGAGVFSERVLRVRRGVKVPVKELSDEGVTKA